MTEDLSDRDRQDEAVRRDPSLLNAEFYRSDPGTHFRLRLQRLLYGPAADDFDNNLIAGVAHRLGRSVEQLAEPMPESPWFLAVELELLLHHVGETLLRLYVGHRDLEPCPWLAISRVRSPRQFKDLVSDIADKPDHELEPTVSRVFFNAWEGLAQDGDGPDSKLRTQSIAIACAFLRDAAKRHLTDAGFYNAAKHGFALQPLGRQVGLVLDSDEEPLGDEEIHARVEASDFSLAWKGPSVSYLVEKKHGENDERLYVEVTQWMEYADQVAHAIMLIEMIENLWNVARGVYTPVTECPINTWREPTPRVLGERRQNKLARHEVPVALRKLSSAARRFSLTILGGPEDPATDGG